MDFTSLENINIMLFKYINADDNAAQTIIYIAKFFANYLLYIVPMILSLFWIFGDKAEREIALKSAIIAFIALGIGQIIVYFFPHPRPFMAGIGRTLIEHASDSSFPSDHMTLFSSIAITYLFAKDYLTAVMWFILSLCIAWSRVYLGVHFPFDMIGAVIVSFFTYIIAEPVWKRVGEKLTNLSITIYEKIF